MYTNSFKVYQKFIQFLDTLRAEATKRIDGISSVDSIENYRKRNYALAGGLETLDIESRLEIKRILSSDEKELITEEKLFNLAEKQIEQFISYYSDSCK